MAAAWVRFATDGEPGWPAFDEGGATRRFGGDADRAAPVVLDDPEGDERRAWDPHALR